MQNPRLTRGFFMHSEKHGIEDWMRQALREALAGKTRVSPNPRTGAVIVRNGKLIGRGRHERYGAAHAEINAIRDAATDLHGAQMFVTLEPCCHYGKTPPCTDAVIAAGISEVFVGMRDPNPMVAGKGIKALEDAGVKVHRNILREACESLNQPFIKMMTKGLPYICAKAAITLDGFMADSRGNSKWITGPESRRIVHRMRAEYDAVLVGMGTVTADDPELTVRDAEGDHPLRVIYDPRGSLSPETKLVRSAGLAPVLLICGEHCEKDWQAGMEKNAVRLIRVKEAGTAGLLEGLRELGSYGIHAVLVEGGAATHSLLAAEDAIDRLELFIAPRLLGSGLPFMKFPPRLMPDAREFFDVQWEQSGTDMHFSGKLKHYTGDN